MTLFRSCATRLSGSPTKLPGTVKPRLRDGNSSIKLTGTAALTPLVAKPKGQGHAEGTAVGGKTVMSGSPTKLPGRVTPIFGYGNSNIKLPGTAASTPGGEGSSQIPGGTRSKVTGIIDGTALGNSRYGIANDIADGIPVAGK